MTCTCPAGQTTIRLIPQGYWRDRKGNRHQNRAFCFDANICAKCLLRPNCIKSNKVKSRTIRLHPQERLIQEARALQASPAFDEFCKLRQVAEHRLARLVQLGIRQASYFGRKKTLFQLMMTATVANLTLVATKTGQMNHKNSHSTSFFAWIFSLIRVDCRYLYQNIQEFVRFAFRKPGFQPDF